MSDGGKGSAPRPMEIPKEEFDNRWETIFPSKKKPVIEQYACAVCGISGVVGYVCSREDCPTRIT